MIDVSIIIVSYNTREMTLESIRSVYEQTKEISFELIVVDNDSKDNSAQAIRDKFLDVDLIELKENIGFARANNLAAEKAKGKYILLLNPDTVVLDKAIQKLYSFAIKNPDNFIYGGRTLYGDGSLNHTSCWKKPTLWSTFCYSMGLTSVFRRHALFDAESYGSWQRNTVRTVDIVTGCFLMIERKMWDRLGGFDQKFFMYGEDADLCLRATKYGAKPIITPGATIVHFCGASEKIRADKIIRLFRAKEQLMMRHWSNNHSVIGIYLLYLSSLFRIFGCYLLLAAGFSKFRESADSWREIWKRRKDWKNS